MKIALIVTLSLALVLAIGRAQFKPVPPPLAGEAAPSASPALPPVEAAPVAGAASNYPAPVLDSPVPETTRNKPVPVRPGGALPGAAPVADPFGGGAGYAPGGPSQNAGYPPSGLSRNNANFTYNERMQNGNQFFGSNRAPVAAPQTAAQMLRESELKVMRQHYEKVWQEILEAEEKVQLATTDGAGNPKPEPGADGAAQQERLQVLRRYAERLQAEITARADAHEERAIPGMGMVPANPASTPAGKPETAYADPSFARSFSTAYANIPMLTAHVDAQHAALASEQVSLNEAQDQLSRTEAAYAQQAVSMEELSHAKFAVKKAEASVQKAEAELKASEAQLAFAKNHAEGAAAGGSPVPTALDPRTTAAPYLTPPVPIVPPTTPPAPAPVVPATPAQTSPGR